VNRLAPILAFALASPSLAAGLCNGQPCTATLEPIPTEAGAAAQIVAEDALRGMPMVEPWSAPVIHVEPMIAPVAEIPGVPLTMASRSPDWLYGLPLLALVPMLVDGGHGSIHAPPLVVIPSTPQELPSAPSSPPAVPEPESWAMMLLGFAWIGAVVRRRKAVLA